MLRVFILILAMTISYVASARNIDFNIELQTFGENVMVELRSGSPGKSKPITNERSKGGHVGFNSLCPGSYFLAIGNDDNVSVTPIRQFEIDHIYTSRITIQRGSGNVSKRSRKSL